MQFKYILLQKKYNPPKIKGIIIDTSKIIPPIAIGISLLMPDKAFCTEIMQEISHLETSGINKTAQEKIINTNNNAAPYLRLIV